VIEWYEIAEVAVAAAAGVLCLILGLFGSKPGDLSMGAVVLVELLLLGQLGITIAQPLVGNRPTGSIVEFYIYVIVALLIPLLAGFWALVERDRWSTVVLGVACLAIAVMMVRMNIIWTGHIA
jgi:formate-dependent nitrite reductase membrane component NrfD